MLPHPVVVSGCFDALERLDAKAAQTQARLDEQILTLVGQRDRLITYRRRIAERLREMAPPPPDTAA